MNKLLNILYVIIPIGIFFFFIPYIFQHYNVETSYYDLMRIHNLGESIYGFILSVTLLNFLLKIRNILLQINMLFISTLYGVNIIAYLFNFSYDANFRLFWIVLVIILTLIFLYKINDWKMKNFKSSNISEKGVYIILKKPNTILQLIQSFFGYGLGTMDLYVNSEENQYLYFYTKKTSKLTRKKLELKNRDYNYYVKISDNYDKFNSLVEKNKIIDSQYHYLTKSCLTVWKPVFNEMGINVNTIFVSKFIKNIKSV